MFSRNLILACILAVGFVSADVPLSVQHDSINSLPESLEVSSTRSLRSMTQETAEGDSTMAAQAGKTKGFLTSGLACSRIGSDGGLKVQANARLLNINLFATLGLGNIQACCQACVDDDRCDTFSFQSNACMLGRSGGGKNVENRLGWLTGSLLNVNALVDL